MYRRARATAGAGLVLLLIATAGPLTAQPPKKVLTFADSDAMEVTDNVVGGNLICFENNPTVHRGDSGGGPNTVTGLQLGQCKPPLPL